MLQMVMTCLVEAIISCCEDEELKPAREFGRGPGICLFVSPWVHLSSTLTSQLCTILSRRADQMTNETWGTNRKLRQSWGFPYMPFCRQIGHNMTITK